MLSSVANLLVLAFVAATFGCAAAPKRLKAITVNDSTVQLEGWLSTTGEWMLHSSRRDVQRYFPYDREESQKCVSMVNDTGQPRSNFTKFHGKKVVVSGFAVRYVDLSDGTSYADMLLSKKYYKEERVESFCLREFVFIVNKIELQ